MLAVIDLIGHTLPMLTIGFTQMKRHPWFGRMRLRQQFNQKGCHRYDISFVYLPTTRIVISNCIWQSSHRTAPSTRWHHKESRVFLSRALPHDLMLVFQHKNWFRILESPDAETLPGKDAVYRFLNCLCIPFNSSTHYENNRPCIPISSVHRFWYLSSTTQTCCSMDITP